MFYSELKKGFKSPFYFISLFIGVVLVFNHIRSLIEESSDIINTDFVNIMVISSFDKFILFDSPGSFFIICLPIICAISYISPYDFYKNDGSFQYSNKNRFIISKFLGNFILGGSLIAFPLLLDIVGCISIYPTIFKGDEVVRGLPIIDGSIFENIYYSNPVICILIAVFICFIYGGLYSGVALLLSIYITSRVVVVLMQGFIGFIILYITEIFNRTNYSYISVLSNFNFPINWFIVYYLGIFVVIFSLFYMSMKKKLLVNYLNCF